MKNWQFLIQKHGDRSWYTLESPNLQIVAGKYRVLARSHLANTDVEVRIIHASAHENPPKRRVLRRSCRTNSEGLMAVIPFTYFHLGDWELRCSGDLISDMLGDSWQYAVKIQVFAEESSAESSQTGILTNNAQANLTESDAFILDQEVAKIDKLDKVKSNNSHNSQINGLTPEAADNISISQPVSPVWLKGETAEQILQSLIDFTLPLSVSEPVYTEVADSDFGRSTTQLCKLNLDRDVYIARWGEDVVISGYAEQGDTAAIENGQLSPNLPINLVVELRSPLQADIILHQYQQNLANKELPFRFDIAINIPADCTSKLILADLKLYGVLNDPSQAMLLVSHTFTITADIAELLTTSPVSWEEATTTSFVSPTSKSVPSSELGLELFNLAKKPKLAEFSLFKPATKQILPPRIKPLGLLSGSEGSSEEFSLQLPKLPQTHPDPLNKLISEPSPQEQTVNLTNILPAIDLDQLTIKQLKSSFPYLKRLSNVTGKLELNKLAGLNAPKLPNLPQTSQSESLPNPPEEPAQIPDTITAPNLLAELITPISDLPEAPFITIDNQEYTAENTPESTSENITGISSLIKLWIQREQSPDAEYFSGEYISSTTQENLLPSDPGVLDEVQVENSQDKVLEKELITEATTEPEPTTLDTSYIPPIPLWLSQEIVIDDTYTDEEDDGEVEAEYLAKYLESNLSQVHHEFLPTPRLYLPDGELLAGTSVKVRLELPQISSAIAVKLWVEDCQTRYLLDGPHVITDLQSNMWGGLEAIAQLNIPFGCLEIRLDAIALDTTTQQESHKISIFKTVIPPDLPSIETNELAEL